MIRKIWLILLSAEKRAFSWYVLLGIIISVLDIIFLWSTVWLIDISTQNSQIHVKPLRGIEFPILFIQQHLIGVIASFVLLFALKNLSYSLLIQAQYKFNYKVATRISENKLAAYFQSSFMNHVNTDSSVHLHQIGQQPIEYCQYMLSGLQQLIIQIFLIVFAIIGLLIFKIQVFLLLAIYIIPPVAGVGFWMKIRLKNVRQRIRVDSKRSIQYLKEALAAYVESYIYDNNNFFSRRYAASQQRLNRQLAILQSIQVQPQRLFEVFAVLGVLILLALNRLHGTTAMSLFSVGIFFASAYKIIPSIVKILSIGGQMNAYAHVLDELVIASQQGQSTPYGSSNEIVHVQFNGVNFQYKQRQQLQASTFSLFKGDFAFLEGMSGSGKTTLINLLLGFLEPTGGNIHYNHHPCLQQVLKTYHKRIGYVKQQVLLIHDTLLKNITLTHDEIDQNRLDYALLVSGLKPLVEQHSEGVYMPIAENGANLSGGQQQRVALARALYKEFDLLILDEAFRELDYTSEAIILSHLQQLALSGKIILLITHNQRSIDYCSKIIRLHEN